MIRLKDLKIAIDSESVNIYCDNGLEEEPEHVCYWHVEEIEEDADVAFAMCNAVQLFYTDPKLLLKKLGLEYE